MTTKMPASIRARWLSLPSLVPCGTMREMSDYELSFGFNERDTADERRAIVELFEQSGITFYVRPDEPAPPAGAGGSGGVVFWIDLVMSHASGVLDGLIGAGLWVGLGRAFRGLQGHFTAANFSIKPARRVSGIPNVNVLYEIRLGESIGGFDESEFSTIPADHKAVVEHVRTHYAFTAQSRAWQTAGVDVEVLRRPTRPFPPPPPSQLPPDLQRPKNQ
jgi:hypothetical protein